MNHPKPHARTQRAISLALAVTLLGACGGGIDTSSADSLAQDGRDTGSRSNR